VDSDTSTSDTVAILANGLAENRPVSRAGAGLGQFTAGLEALTVSWPRCWSPTARGDQAVMVTVRGAPAGATPGGGPQRGQLPADQVRLQRGRPNWGRIMMALGKSAARIDQDKVGIASATSPS